jgi:hypothetical protein
MRRFRLITLIAMTALASLVGAAPAHALSATNHNETLLADPT